MEDLKVIGSDVGNDALKLYLKEPTFDDKYKLEIMNVVSPGYKRRLLGQEKGQLVNLLDVTITKGKEELGRYFVGGLAYKGNRGDLLETNKNIKKAKNINTIILLMTGIAFSQYDPAKPRKTVNVALGTLLPTEEFWYEDEDLVEAYIKDIKQPYTVKFNSPNFKGAEITINAVEANVNPESVTALLTALYEMDGNERENVQIENRVHLGITIGNVTTEAAIFDDGEFDERAFFGKNLGTADPLGRIIGELGINSTRHEIDYYIRKKKPLIINSVDRTKDLERISKKNFDFFVQQLVNELFHKLGEQGVNVQRITDVHLAGGGAISTFDSIEKAMGLKNVSLVEDPRFANARGALLSILQYLDEINPSAEVFDEIASDKVK